MTATIAPPATAPALYPPAVPGQTGPLPLPKLLWRLVRNPLTSLPQSVYEEGIVVRDSGRFVVAWVTDPVLIEKVLLHEADQFPKSPVQKRVFANLGEGILNAEGTSWRWQRRTAAPLFRPADLASLVPAMAAAAEAQLDRWALGGADCLQEVDRDMSVTTFRVLSATIFAGSVDAEANEILRCIERTLSTISWAIAAALMRFPAWL
jgi:cytochrome P450